jgi:hypothetical protein
MAVGDLSEILAELDSLGERISDLAIELLHEAMREIDPKGSPSARAEKVVTRARRSVEKARYLLTTLDLGDR